MNFKTLPGTSVALSLASLLVVGLLVSPTSASAATIKSGDACAPVGAKFTQGKTEFVCTKSGSKGKWKAAKAASPSPTAQEKFVMPKVVGMNLQLAQDLLQSKGSYIIDQEDYKGLNRVQVLDSNWKVCAQSPAAGKKVLISAVVTLSAVKLTEKC